MKVYLAGPMRNRPFFNRENFLSAKEFLEYGGEYQVITPIELDQESGINPLDYPDGVPDSSIPLRDLIRRDLDAIDECDAVVTLPGSQYSSGAAVEVAYAQFLGKPVFDYKEFD